MKKAALCLMSLTLAVTLSACGTKKEANEPSTPSGGTQGGTTVSAAETLYKQNCVSCHGEDLAGKVGARSNLQKVGSKMTKDQIAKQIKNGGSGMPAMGGRLKDDQIETLAVWLSEKK